MHDTFFIKKIKKKIDPENMTNSFFLGLRKFSNLNVLHKGLLMQDWVFRLGLAPKKLTANSTKCPLFPLSIQSARKLILTFEHFALSSKIGFLGSFSNETKYWWLKVQLFWGFTGSLNLLNIQSQFAYTVWTSKSDIFGFSCIQVLDSSWITSS